MSISNSITALTQSRESLWATRKTTQKDRLTTQIV